MHRRTQFTRSEVRCEGDGPLPKVSGYAAVYYRADDPGSEYELFRDGNHVVVERLLPGCFDRACTEDDVRALINHNPDMLLGRAKAGTLRLSVDARGLRYEITPPDTQAARDLVANLRLGNVDGSSFSFDYTDRSRRDVEEGGTYRHVIEVRAVKLYDVGPVTFPAYESTTAGVRSASQEALREELERWKAERSGTHGKTLALRAAAVTACLGL